MSDIEDKPPSNDMHAKMDKTSNRKYNSSSEALLSFNDDSIVKYDSQLLISLDSLNKKIHHNKSESTPPLYPYSRQKRNSLIKSGYNKIKQTAIEGTGHIIDTASYVAKTISHYSFKVIAFWELPEWLRDNKYLHYKHRPQLDTFRRCFSSIFSIHTETGNIWTHLIGLILLIIAMVYIYVRPSINPEILYPVGAKEVFLYLAFFVGGCLCLTFSWLFHTLCCHSPNIAKLFAKLDYSGISFLICGSGIPAYYYAFFCNLTLQIVYITTSAVLALSCIIVSLWDQMSTPRCRPIRAVVFLAFGLSAIIPVVHHFVIYPYDYSYQALQLPWLASMGSCYVFGCLMYMFLIPERLFPGQINIVFQSHQIFHVLVVVAAFLHLRALCGMAEFRHHNGTNCTNELQFQRHK